LVLISRTDGLTSSALRVGGLVAHHACIALPGPFLDTKRVAPPFSAWCGRGLFLVGLILFVRFDIGLVTTKQPVEVPGNKCFAGDLTIRAANLFDGAPMLLLTVRRAHRLNQISKGGRVNNIDALADGISEGLVGSLPLFLALFTLGGIQRGRIIAIGIRGTDKVDVPRHKGFLGDDAGTVRIDDGKLLVLLVSIKALADCIEQIVKFAAGKRRCALGNLVVGGPCRLGGAD